MLRFAAEYDAESTGLKPDGRFAGATALQASVTRTTTPPGSRSVCRVAPGTVSIRASSWNISI